MTVASVCVSSDPSGAPTGSSRSAITATDGELLMRFSRHRDSSAFAQIVERHGGLVWIVCREVLGHREDVEDAFQATFFILAERAAKIRSCDSAAAWLYKVAQRTSLAARRKRSRRREEELLTEPPQDEAARPLIHDQRMIYVLMEELRGLPERYQSPLMLRYLEGRSRRSIAAETDSTIAQIQGRLVRGRRLLRSRLARRGVSLSLAAAAMTSASAAASAAVTPSLVAASATNCVGLIASGAAGGASVAALELARQGVKAMWLASLMKTTTAVSAMFVVAGVAWAVQAGVGGGNDGPDAASAAKVVALQGGATADQSANEDLAEGEKKREAQVAREEADNLERRIDNSQDLLTELIDQKATQSADLENQQRRKKYVEREIEHLQEKLIEIRSPQQIDESSSAEKEAKQKREQLGDIIGAQIDSLQAELSKATMETAKMSAGLEILQMKLERQRRRVDELNLLADQMALSASLPAVSPETGAATVAKGTDGKLEPHDTVRINVANSFADAPLNSVYTVESMGTVALGPTYGRVDVKGLTVLEAEAAITKHLAKIIENPQVQVTVNEKQSDAQLDQLLRTIAALQAENAHLKKQLQPLRSR